MKFKILLLWVTVSITIHALPLSIRKSIKDSTIKPGDISIYIKEIGKSTPIVAHNASIARTPASVIKVLSTYASLVKLGFDYRIPTKVYTRGNLRQGILYGDLIVKGYGDPTLRSRDLDDMVSAIKGKGIRKITGNIVIDRSYFRVGNRDNSGFDKNIYSAYNAMPDAMMFNERISTICVEANKNVVYKKIPDGSYTIIDHLKRVSKPCTGRYSWPGVSIDTRSNQTKVLLKGKISKNCAKRNICKVITKPYTSFYYALKDSLKRAGINVQGTMRLRKVASNAKLIFTHYSQTLEKIVSTTAKKSNNLYARHLLLILGAETYGAPATLNKGRRAVESILRAKGALGFGDLKIDNGCGLSRNAKITAKLLAGIYEHAYDEYGERWMQTLSIAGVDGTIKKRFRGTPVKNRAWMKTGTLNRVKNIGGYVKSKSGKLYSVVILVHSNRGNWRASKLENDIILWLVNHKENFTKKEINTYLKPEHTLSVNQLMTRYTKEDSTAQIGHFVEKESTLY